jgi:hypothetical protein
LRETRPPDKARPAQVIPPAAALYGRGARGAAVVVLAFDLAIAVARCGPPTAVRVGVVARDGAVPILITVVGGRDAAEVSDHVLDLRLRDHLLALEDAAEQQPDDDQHDRDLDQSEALLLFSHTVTPDWVHGALTTQHVSCQELRY